MTSKPTDSALLKRIHADYRAKLAAENAHAETLRARHAEITARIEAIQATRGAALIEARYALAKARHARKLPTKPSLPLEDLPLFRKDAAA